MLGPDLRCTSYGSTSSSRWHSTYSVTFPSLDTLALADGGNFDIIRTPGGQIWKLLLNRAGGGAVLPEVWVNDAARAVRNRELEEEARTRLRDQQIRVRNSGAGAANPDHSFDKRGASTFTVRES